MIHCNGWRRDLERHHWILANHVAYTLGAPSESEAPEEINYSDWLQIEYQGAEGSCAGHMASSIAEVCNWIQTVGGIVQLSRMFAYLSGQMECGLLGADQGCTIEGVIKAATIRGIPLESTFPYSGIYSTDIPQAAADEAVEHKLHSYSVLESERDVFGFQARGIGGIALGIPWTEALRQTTGVIELADAQPTRRNALLGYHAVPLLGYSKRKDQQGRNYHKLPNSHGRQWGANGWGEIAPAVVDWWIASQCVVLGVSDMQVYGERKIKSFRGLMA